MNISDVCNIIDLFIDIENFSNKICCRYIAVYDLFKICGNNHLPYYNSMLMIGILRHKFPLRFKNVYRIVDDELYDIWGNMPLFDGSLIHLTEKPTCTLQYDA